MEQRLDEWTSMSAERLGHQDVEVLSLRLPSRPEAAHEARAHLRGLPLEPEVLDTVSLLATELLTNAVRHGRAPEDADIELVVRRRGSIVRVEVRNEGDGFGWRRRPLQPSRPGGLGLVLVDRMADRWGISSDSGTRVWLELGRAS